MMVFSRIRLIFACMLIFAVAACDNAEERAQGHYKRGMTLMEAGEDRKAMLEFKNALQLNSEALEPRLEFARLLRKYGERGVIANYLKVIEIEPNHLEARLAVASIQVQIGDIGAREHLKAAAKIEPENQELRALQAAFEQQQGNLEKAAEIARDLLKDAPGNVTAVNVLVTQLNTNTDYTGAIRLLDDALVANPKALPLHINKLKALEGLNDQTAIGEQLSVMAKTFPDNVDILRGYVQWYLNEGQPENAISLQREVAQTFPDDPGNALLVVTLLLQFEGIEAARAEMSKLSSGEDHKIVFGRAHADFDAQQGDIPAGIARLEELAKIEMPKPERLAVQGQLANFHRSTGDKGKAQEIAQEILKEDTENVEALKLRALYAIDTDEPQKAVTDLRVALGKRAQDPSILMLLALAHERNGSMGLAQERMALAVQASNVGITESLRYAEFLTRQGNGEIAIGVLDDALDKRGDTAALLSGLGQVQLAMSDWKGASSTVERLRALPQNPAALQMAQDLQVAILGGQRKFDQSIGILREMWEVAGERSSAMENLVSSYVRSGRAQDAAEFLDGVLAEDVANIRANLLRGAVHAFEGEMESAEARYSKVIKDHPTQESGYGALANLLLSQARLEEADAVMAEGIAKAENVERLLFTRAARMEQQGDFEGAIAIYEKLYDANRSSDVLANNLASLVSEFREDPASLERAFNIAKRLRASDNPAFKDTYGWILYKRGEYERAMPALKDAARGVPNNAVVQYHLGMVYEKLGQKDLAIEQLERALVLGEGRELPQLQIARDTLQILRGG